MRNSAVNSRTAFACLAVACLQSATRLLAQSPEWQTLHAQGSLLPIQEGYYGSTHLVKGTAGSAFIFILWPEQPASDWYIQIANAETQKVVTSFYIGSEPRQEWRATFPETAEYTISLVADKPGTYRSTFSVLTAEKWDRVQLVDAEGDSSIPGAPDLTFLDIILENGTLTVSATFAEQGFDGKRTSVCVGFNKDGDYNTGARSPAWPQGIDALLNIGAPSPGCYREGIGISSVEGNSGELSRGTFGRMSRGELGLDREIQLFVFVTHIGADGITNIVDVVPGGPLPNNWIKFKIN